MRGSHNGTYARDEDFRRTRRGSDDTATFGGSTQGSVTSKPQGRDQERDRGRDRGRDRERDWERDRARDRERDRDLNNGHEPSGRGFVKRQEFGSVDKGIDLVQLESVLDVVSRVDPTGDLARLSREVVAQRRELWRQLDRRRASEETFEPQRRMDRVLDERRKAQTDIEGDKKHLAHLQDELGFVAREVRDAEEDLVVLREGTEANSREIGPSRHAPAPYLEEESERSDVIAKVRAERELLQNDEREIERLRARATEIFKQKAEVQREQQTLTEKQRRAEKELSMMLTSLEIERDAVSKIRSNRIKMMEEKNVLQREMMDVSQEKWLKDHRISAPPRSDGIGLPAGAPKRPLQAQRPFDRPKGVQQDDVQRLSSSSMGSRSDMSGRRKGVPAESPADHSFRTSFAM